MELISTCMPGTPPSAFPKQSHLLIKNSWIIYDLLFSYSTWGRWIQIKLIFSKVTRISRDRCKIKSQEVQLTFLTSLLYQVRSQTGCQNPLTLLKVLEEVRSEGEEYGRTRNCMSWHEHFRGTGCSFLPRLPSKHFVCCVTLCRPLWPVFLVLVTASVLMAVCSPPRPFPHPAQRNWGEPAVTRKALWA